jgi:hypothetical protein
MKKETTEIITCSLLTLVVLAILTFIEDNLAISYVAFLVIVLGLIFIIPISKKENREDSIYIFILFFLIYIIHTSIVHYGLIDVYDLPFIKPDENFFTNSSYDVSTKLKNGMSFFELDQLYIEGTASVYYYGLVAMFANMVGENSVLILKISVVFLSSLIPMILYNIGRLYFAKELSFSIAAIYGLFSFVPYLSTMLLRDIHVAVIFLLTFYILLNKVSILNLLVLFLVSFVSYYLRPQTGLFMMGFNVIYIFVFIRNMNISKYIRIFIYVMLFGVFLLLVYALGLFDSYILTADSPGNATAADKLTGLGAKIASLPFPLNTAALFAFSQIEPFPPAWIFQGLNKGLFQITYLIAGIAWFTGWGFLIYGLFVKKILNKLDLKMKFMFFMSILYVMLIASIVASMRRQMPVYPIIYLLMVFSYLEMNSSERVRVWIGMGLLYLTLVLSINYIKI